MGNIEEISSKISAIDGKISDNAQTVSKMQADVEEFMKLRLKNVLSEADIRYDVVDAVFVNIDDIYGATLRAKAVDEAVKKGMDTDIQAFNRAGNISRKDETVQAICDEALFVDAAEGKLCEAYQTVKSQVDALVAKQDYAGAVAELTKLAAPIDGFFDAVMVMDKDEKIKNNRLGLLKAVDQLICTVADFSKIVLA